MPVSLGNAARFYCLILTASQGRATIRKVNTSTVAQLEDNLHQFFHGVEVERSNPSTPMALFRLFGAFSARPT
jgi:hypothetical protein